MNRETRHYWLAPTIYLGWLFTTAAIAAADDKDDFSTACREAKVFENKSEYSAAAREYEHALVLAERLFGDEAVETATVLCHGNRI